MFGTEAISSLEQDSSVKNQNWNFGLPSMVRVSTRLYNKWYLVCINHTSGGTKESHERWNDCDGKNFAKSKDRKG